MIDISKGNFATPLIWFVLSTTNERSQMLSATQGDSATHWFKAWDLQADLKEDCIDQSVTASYIYNINQSRHNDHWSELPHRGNSVLIVNRIILHTVPWERERI
jgi:hypothetical protein